MTIATDHRPECLRGETTHSRLGSTRHAFRHGVDYVLIDPDAPGPYPRLFSRNRINLASVADRMHGGPRGAGRGAAWAREVLAAHDAPEGLSLRLLTQPRFLGLWFNPVSFWLAFRDGALVAAIAEVSNTFGERHSYLCANPGYAPIRPGDRIHAEKVFHVSPFQDVAGGYSFAFDLSPDRIAIRIVLTRGTEGLIATLSGARVPMTDRALVAAALRRPFGPLRTLALIYWHALRLKLKGVAYRPRPLPPEQDVSR
ncbi:MAG TPA: DUF1365 domain-containing protein [Pararhodobacter sp.]|uniref:DUF1365 domain-containing protein n=1 Tax=Pararhodobacter sp. TaxID=2127056 RepID=UPI002B852FA1|nr:DUF1365 domain-containing protein [Pararhodobacter sp.]HPD91124.1 DUF1365 domain-containing protein [Pararhodobacter sp.]